MLTRVDPDTECGSKWPLEGTLKAPGSLADFLPARGHLEIRYPKAHRFWDISGSVVATIEDEIPALRCTQLTGQRGIEMSGRPGSGVELAFFGWERLGIEIDVRAAPDHFEENALRFFRIVAAAFELEELERVGNRYAYLFQTETSQTADDLLENRRIWSMAQSLAVFGEPDARGVILRTILGEHDRRIRLETSAGEHTVKGTRYSGIVVDVDFSLLNKTTAEKLDLPDFLRWNRRFVRNNLHEVLRVRE